MPSKFDENNKGLPSLEFSSAASAQQPIKPPEVASKMVEESAPYPEYRPDGSIANQVKAESHTAEMRKDDAQARDSNQARKADFLKRIQKELEDRSRGDDIER